MILVGAVLAGPEPMLARLVRGCIALAFTASVPADQSSPCLADPVKGGELSYMGSTGVATAYSSVLSRLYTAQSCRIAGTR